MHTLQYPDPLTPLFRIGTILWRGDLKFAGSKLNRTRATNEPWNFDNLKTPSGTYKVKLAVSDNNFTYEPTVSASTTVGVVVFINNPPPDPLWTHLLVKHVSFQPRQVPDPEDPNRLISHPNGFIVAKFAPLLAWDTFLDFRQEMFDHFIKNRGASIGHRLGWSLMTQLPSYRPKECRLVSKLSYQDKSISYGHVRQVLPTGSSG